MSSTESEIAKTVRSMIQQYKLVFAKQIRDKIAELSIEYCYGCEVSHPSQTHHACLMWTELEQFYVYRDEAYEKCKSERLTTYERVTTILDLSFEAKFAFFELLFDKNMTPKENEVFSMVERMIRLEDRFVS